ncbi:hypothetical protein D3C85_1058030 [compost metagenome]
MSMTAPLMIGEDRLTPAFTKSAVIFSEFRIWTVALRMMASAMTAWPLSMANSGAMGVELFGLNTNT